MRAEQNTQQKDSCLLTRKRVLTRHGICQCLALGLPAFRILRNKFLLFISHWLFLF